MQTALCINCILCGMSAHFTDVHLLSRLLGGGGLRPQRSQSSLPVSLDLLTWGYFHQAHGQPLRKQERGPLLTQRPQQAFPTGGRNSFPTLFRVPNPKRLLCSWMRVAPPSSNQKTMDQAGARKASEPICHLPHMGTNHPRRYLHLGTPFPEALPLLPTLPRYW